MTYLPKNLDYGLNHLLGGNSSFVGVHKPFAETYLIFFLLKLLIGRVICSNHEISYSIMCCNF